MTIIARPSEIITTKKLVDAGYGRTGLGRRGYAGLVREDKKKFSAYEDFSFADDFEIKNAKGEVVLSIDQDGDLTMRGGGAFTGDVSTGGGDVNTGSGIVINYVGKSLAFLLGSDPDMSDLLHCRVQIVDALAKLVSTTDPTLNTDLIWSGFSSTGVTPFFYKVSGVLTQWPAAGVPKASWGEQGVCLVPASANALVSGTTYYARGWLWDGAAYGQPDDISFVG